MKSIINKTTSLLWHLASHGRVLSLPAIADIMFVVGTAAITFATIEGASRRIPKARMTKKKKNIETALPLVVAVQDFKDTKAPCTIEPIEETDSHISINPAIIVTATKAAIAEDIDTTIAEDVADTTIAEDVKTTISKDVETTISKDVGTTIAGIADATECAREVDSPLHANEPCEASNIGISESATVVLEGQDSTHNEANTHVYAHALPAIDIIEVDLSTVDDIDDSAASASSTHYNEFERFLNEDRMMWIPRPSKRVLGKMKRVVNKAERCDHNEGTARPTHVEVSADGRHVPSGMHVASSDDNTVERARKFSTE